MWVAGKPRVSVTVLSHPASIARVQVAPEFAMAFTGVLTAGITTSRPVAFGAAALRMPPLMSVPPL